MAIDVERLLTEALTQHGIRLDPHDPAVVLVTLNRLVLEEAAKSVAAEIRTATSEFEEAAARIQSRLGAAVAATLRSSTAPNRFPAGSLRRASLAVSVSLGASLLLTGIALGKWVLR
jgi:hypothetical protein